MRARVRPLFEIMGTPSSLTTAPYLNDYLTITNNTFASGYYAKGYRGGTSAAGSIYNVSNLFIEGNTFPLCAGIFESPQPSTLDVFLGASSIQDALAKADYLALMPASNPLSPLSVYPRSTTVGVTVESVEVHDRAVVLRAHAPVVLGEPDHVDLVLRCL